MNVLLNKMLRMLQTAAGSRPAPAALPRRVRLLLETLENRWLLATTRLWIAGVDSTWNDPNNWADPTGLPGKPATGDTVIFNPALVQGGKQGTNTASTCDIANLSLAKLTIASGYSKTILLDNPLQVGNNAADSTAVGTMAGGTLTGGDNFSISRGIFTWSGGTMGSGPVEGKTEVGAAATLNIQLGASKLGWALDNAGTVNQANNQDIVM